jgi:hypothetical protein
MISTLFILGIVYWPSLQHSLQKAWRRLAMTRPAANAGTEPDSSAAPCERASDIKKTRPDESSQPS